MARFCDKCLPANYEWAFNVVQSPSGGDWKDEFWSCDTHKVDLPTGWRVIHPAEWKAWRTEQLRRESPGWVPPPYWTGV